MTVRTGAGVLLGLCGAYVLLWLALDALPLLDFPNHLARATILGDLWLDGGRRFGQAFAADLRVAPYILGDLLLAPLTQWLPPDVAGRLWLALLFVALPASFVTFLRAFDYRGWQLVVGGAAAAFLATDWFFVVGFGAFRLGTVLALLALAAWRLVGTRGAHGYAAYALLVFACYLAHLGSFVMLGVAAATLTLVALLRRRTSFVAAIAYGLPFVALLALYFATGSGETQGAVDPGTALRKALRLATPFARYDLRVDAVLVALLVAGLVAAAWRSRARMAPEPALPAAAAACLLAYALLPIARGSVYDVDVRALPFAVLFVVAVALRWVDPGRAPAVPACAALLLLLIGNLAYLAVHLVPGNERAREYRRAIQVLPERTTFLPVATLPPVGRTHPLLHAHAWATIDRGAVSPYLFSADRNDAMTYFRYRRRGVEPFIFWYTRGGPEPDWAAVARDYRHLVVTEPVDLARIGVAGRWRLRNPVASVLDVAGAPTASGTIEAAATVPTGEPAAR